MILVERRKDNKKVGMLLEEEKTLYIFDRNQLTLLLVSRFKKRVLP